MKNVIVPVDFSKSADNACKYAIAMARKTNARVTLMHTYETPFIYSDVPFSTVQMDFQVIHDTALKNLKKYHEKIKKIAPGLKIDMILQQGLASARITEIALEKKADLIVMGTTGKGAVERVLMGSNTSRVIKHAPCIVLAVPLKAKFNGFKKIVYATDLLNDNLNHAKTLIPFAKTYNSEIIFLNITNDLISDKAEDFDKILKKIRKHIPYSKTSAYLSDDISVANGINSFLKKHKASCLAMYTHHRNIFKSIFQSSITKAVAVHTNIPLLVLHEKDFI